MRSHDPVSVQPFMRLSRLPDYGVKRDEPDPRGWTVVNRGGRKVGQVKDLLVDTERMTARYLDIELDTKLFDWQGEDPRVLVPVARAYVNGKHLVVEDLSETWVADLRVERDAHMREFWDRWWRRETYRRNDELQTSLHPDDLMRAINDAKPGETVRIPVVNEEIVVQRLPAADTASGETHVHHGGDRPLQR
jgi:sporulation protein YlmC with PRC-barrel domain